jgi:hypothetical protein
VSISSIDTLKIKVYSCEPYNLSSVLAIPVKPQNIQVSFSRKTIKPGGEANIIIKKKMSDSSFVSFSAGQLFTVVLFQEDEYGSIYSEAAGFSTNCHSDTPEPFTVRGALSLKPDSAKLNIRVSTVDNGTEIAGFGYITVSKMNSSIKAYFSQTLLHPKDTVNIVVKKIGADGVETDFADTTHYEVIFKDGCDLGNILTADGRTGKYFNGLLKPLRFVVSDSVNGNSAVKFHLRVGVNMDNTLQSSVQKLQVNKTTAKTINKAVSKNAAAAGQRQLLIGDNIYCAAETPVVPEYSIAEGTISSTRLKILYPLATSADETISSVPQMPVVNCMAQLANYKDGQVTFEWEYWLSYSFERYHKYKSNKLSPRTGKMSFNGISKAQNDEITIWKVPFLKDSTKNVKLTAITPVDNYYKFNNPKRHYPGNDNEVITEWRHDNNVFTGGYVYVQVTAKDSRGNILGVDTLRANKVIGENPDKSDVISAASSNEMRSILKGESKYFQFKSGRPNYGWPNGYGLMQLDNSPAANELQLWNWRANLDGGVTKLEKIKTKISEELITHPATDTVFVLLKQIFRQYNANQNYFDFNKYTKKWVLNDDAILDTKKKIDDAENNGINYANKIYDIYKHLTW